MNTCHRHCVGLPFLLSEKPLLRDAEQLGGTHSVLSVPQTFDTRDKTAIIGTYLTSLTSVWGGRRGTAGVRAGGVEEGEGGGGEEHQARQGRAGQVPKGK